MHKRIFTAAIAVGLAAAIVAFAVGPTAIAQDKKDSGYKNLQVLPKNIEKKVLKNRMKAIAKATGKSCEDCHDTDDFSKDTDLKKAARKMMKMTSAINSQLKKDKIKKTVDCVTCHRGEAKPSK
jgi:peptidoglycan hydrolase CwlO-like protein